MNQKLNEKTADTFLSFVRKLDPEHELVQPPVVRFMRYTHLESGDICHVWTMTMKVACLRRKPDWAKSEAQITGISHDIVTVGCALPLVFPCPFFPMQACNEEGGEIFTEEKGFTPWAFPFNTSGITDLDRQIAELTAAKERATAAHDSYEVTRLRDRIDKLRKSKDALKRLQATSRGGMKS